jgi:hypothetical protein
MVLLHAAPNSAPAAVIDIDTFDLPNPAQFFIVPLGTNPSKTITDMVAGVLGGEREGVFQVYGEGVINSATGLIGKNGGMSAFQFGTVGNSPASATLTYNGVGNVGLGGIDLTSAGTNSRFEIQFVSSDALPTAGLNVQIIVTSATGSKSSTVVAPNQQSAYTLAIPFASFVGPGSLSQADSVTIVFNGNQTPNIDFEIYSIAAVPEPASWLLMAFGGAAACFKLARRRHRGA